MIKYVTELLAMILRTLRGEGESHSLPHTRREKWLCRFELITEWPLLILALVTIPLVIVAEADHSKAEVIDWAFVVISVVFALDLGIRTSLANHRLTYLARHWLDVGVVLVSGVASAATLLPKGSSWFGLANVARSARAVRILRLTRAASNLARAGKDGVTLLKRRRLGWVVFVFLLAIFVTAGWMSMLEDKNELNGYLDGLYWAIGTTTTVGNTATPSTDAGKALQAVVMFVGLIFVAWFTANIAAFLVEGDKGVTLEEVMHKLELVEAELKALRAERITTEDT